MADNHIAQQNEPPATTSNLIGQSYPIMVNGRRLYSVFQHLGARIRTANPSIEDWQSFEMIHAGSRKVYLKGAKLEYILYLQVSIF